MRVIKVHQQQYAHCCDSVLVHGWGRRAGEEAINPGKSLIWVLFDRGGANQKKVLVLREALLHSSIVLASFNVIKQPVKRYMYKWKKKLERIMTSRQIKLPLDSQPNLLMLMMHTSSESLSLMWEETAKFASENQEEEVLHHRQPDTQYNEMLIDQ